MKAAFTLAFQPIFKPRGYTSPVSIDRGPPAPVRGYK